MTGSSSTPLVRRVDTEHVYEIVVDGERAGLTAYRDRGGQRVFRHTEIDDAHSGRGLASHLVRRALADTRDAGLRIVPVCPYVAQWLKRHAEFGDVTDPVTPDVLRWLETQTG
jgi:predicted GNAT family acetyltransferase